VDAGNFHASLACLFTTAVDELATQLGKLDGLSLGECATILAATQESLYGVLHAKLSRVLLLELNAARVTGRLGGEDGSQRWEQFLQLSSQQNFWDELAEHYPSMRARIDCIVSNRCTASLHFAQRWATDHTSLAPLGIHAPGELLEVNFGAGDSHRGGLTVALLRCTGGQVVYKPRSVAVDAALTHFIAGLRDIDSGAMAIRVPRVVVRDDYGWAEFVEHRYASGDDELRGFYRGIGQWLAIMRLLGGSDLHAENMIAQGASPIVIDCETLFTPKTPPSPSGFGQALDQAGEMITGTVLNIGMLPGRSAGLGWRGVDMSAVGSLPGQQPILSQIDIIEAGTDQAHIGTTLVQAPISQNHPSPQPALAQYWPEVLSAFEQTTASLQQLDAAGLLQIRLRAFDDCRIRVVPRSTEVYAEVARMLWHPVSLHKQEPARQRAHELFARMAVNVSSAPADPAVIDAEIEDLLVGDIPFFSTPAGHGQLQGPRGTLWRAPQNLVDAALLNWRAADMRFEGNVIRAALVSAYINQGWMPDEASMWPEHARSGDIDRRRRSQAARILRELVDTAIRGKDGSVAWIAPVLSPETGWSVQPLEQDLYGGSSGVAILIAAYLSETRAGRADPVAGLDQLFAATLHTLGLAEAKRESQRLQNIAVRPLPPGGYFGLGSLIWTRLTLADWGIDDGDGLQRASLIANGIPEAAAATDIHDLLSGLAGAIPPLLMLARRSADERYLRIACDLADTLCAQATYNGDCAYWSHGQWPDGIGGFAHGVTGIGWALTKLARQTGNARYLQTAQAAFAFEDSLFDITEQNWLDLRLLDGVKTAAAWCHGAVGIGLAHLDLDPQLQDPRTRPLLRRASTATWRLGLGWNHCVCHGDLSAWELLDAAIAAGEGPPGVSRENLLERVLTSLETYGPICGMTRAASSPGLMPGMGGIAYQLLKAHPDSNLPSILTLGDCGL